MKPERNEIEKMCEEVFREIGKLKIPANKNYGQYVAEEAYFQTQSGLTKVLFTEFMGNSYKMGLLDTAESRNTFRNMITLLTSDKDNKDNKLSYSSMVLEVLDRIDRREQELENLKKDIERIIGVNKDTDKGTDTKLGVYESMNPEERKNIMKLLLEAGADLNKTDTAENKINTKSPEERKNIMKLLLEAGADLDKTDTAEDKTKAKENKTAALEMLTKILVSEKEKQDTGPEL